MNDDSGSLGSAAPAGPGVHATVAGWRDGLLAAVVLVLERPDVWPVALAGFLARGGILVFLLPIVVLPSPIGIATFVGADAVTAGGPSTGLVAAIAAATVATTALVVLGGLIGAAADRSTVRVALADDGPVARLAPGGEAVRPTSVPVRRRVLLELLAVRLISHMPTMAAVAFGIGRLGQVTYDELVLPGDLTMPLAVRVAREAPDAILAILVAWLAGELVGGVAVRRRLLSRRDGLAALAAAVRDLLLRPVPMLATFLIGVAGLALAIAPALVAVSVAWSRLGTSLRSDPVSPQTALLVGLLVATWLGGLLLGGIAAAWRSAWATAEAVRTIDAPAGPVGQAIGAGDEAIETRSLAPRTRWARRRGT